jgi:osmotically-inducible protein OsmY
LYIRFSIVFVLALQVCLLQGCSNIISATTDDSFEEQPAERSTGGFIDDEMIETKALVNIDKSGEELAQSHIVVVSFNGTVLLAGQVKSEELRQSAAKAVDKINVRRIHNEITVSGDTPMVARSNDTWITSKIKSKILVNGDIDGSTIKVVTENGVVYFLGLVTKK